MELGELKIECLAVMDELNEPITMETLENFESDDSYKDLFARMPGAINRAMDRMATLKKLPIKDVVLSNPEKKGGYYIYDLNTVPGFRNVKRVSCMFDNGTVDAELDYFYEGHRLMIYAGYNGEIRLYYYPKSPAITRDMLNTDEVDIPDELARIIPYYVKSDLMTRDEPSLATQARNKFEEALEEMDLNEDDYFSETIKKDYGIE